MKKIKILFLAAMIMTIAITFVYGETLKSLDYHGRWPDASQRAAAIDNDGSLLFLADGNVITVLTSADLKVVSKLALDISTGIKGLVINQQNTHLYAACGIDGLQIIDITDSQAPILSGSLTDASDNNKIFGSGVACLYDRVYVADVYYGLRVIDVSGPANPFQETVYQQVNVNSSGIIFSGGHENLAVEEINDVIYALVLDKYRGLRVFAIEDSTISLVTNYPAGSEITSLYDTKPVTDIVIIEKKYAVISDYENGLAFVDLFSDTEYPETILLKSVVNLETPGSASSLSVFGNLLYVADGHSGLQIVDISDITIPEITGNFETSGAHSVIADKQIAFISDSIAGLQRVDCSVKSNPVATHLFDTPSDTDALFVKDSYVYILDDDETGEGLRIIHFPVSNQYEMTGFCKTPGKANNIYVEGHYAYLADGGSGITVIDVNDPEIPQITTSINASGSIENAVDIYGASGFVYLADKNNGIFAFDISDPATPVLVGSFNQGKRYESIYVLDAYSYSAHGIGIDIIDVSDPASMNLAGTMITEGEASDIVADNDYGLLADGTAGFKLINILNPENPFLENRYETISKCEAVSVYSVFVHCAVGTAGVEVIGVSNENPPKLNYVIDYDTPGYAADIFVAGDDAARFTYVADSSGGLVVFKHNDQYAGGIDEQAFTESTDDRGWDNACFISTLFDFN